MKGLAINIARQTKENEDFRKVVCKGRNIEVVLTTLQANQATMETTNSVADKFIRIENGEGIIDIGGFPLFVEDGSGIMIPQGVKFSIRNITDTALKFTTISMCEGLRAV